MHWYYDISNYDLSNVLMGIVQWTFWSGQRRERFLDIDGTERFVSQWPWQMRSICIDEFYGGAVRKRGIDLTIRVKLAATRHFSHRQSYLWDGNVLTVILIGSGVRYTGACVYWSHEISSQISMYQCVPIRSFYLRHHLPTRVHHVARVFYRSSIILQQTSLQAYVKRNKQNVV